MLTGILVQLRAGEARDGRDRLVPPRGQGDAARRARCRSSRRSSRPARSRSSRASPPAPTSCSSACTRTTSSSASTAPWLTTRRIDGQFPNYRQLLPEQFEHELAAAARGAARRRPPRVGDGAAQLAAAAALRRRRADRVGADAGRRRGARVAAGRRSPPTRWRSASTRSSSATGLESIDSPTVTLQADQPAAPGRARGRDRRLHVPDHADPARGLIVAHVTLRNYRSYASLDLDLTARDRARRRRERRRQDEPARGAARRDAGLLAAHAHRRAAVRFGERGRSSRCDVDRDGVCTRGAASSCRSRRGEDGRARRCAPAVGRVAAARVRGARLHARPARRREGRARRRGARTSTASLGRLQPGAGRPCRRTTRRRSRSATRRCAASSSASRGRDALAPWTERVARARRAARRGSPGDDRGARRRASRSVRGRARPAPTRGSLRRRAADRGGARGAARRATSHAASTGLGPHLDDVRIAAGDRDLRSFGSQGEQRLARARAAARGGGAAAVRAAAAPRRRALGARLAPPRACSRTASPGWSRS